MYVQVAQAYPQIKERNLDGSVTPVFRSSGSLDAYDLVLPDATWRLGGPKCDLPPCMPWTSF